MMKKKIIWTGFDHKIRRLNQDHIEGLPSTLIVAVSGGLDSVALLHTILKIESKRKIIVAHYHHGPTDDVKQQKYRDQALQFVKKLTTDLQKQYPHRDLHFSSQKSTISLRSEADFRQARRAFFDQLIEENKGLVLTGHHADDWLETVLMKMLRGVGPDKFFSFKVRSEKVFRPFLEISKNEIQQQALSEKWSWLEDPSNQNSLFLRNWLRHQWLPLLDQKSSQARHRFSQSLYRLSQTFDEKPHFDLVYSNSTKGFKALDRQWLKSLTVSSQKRALASFLYAQKVHDFTEGHLKEIIKRLDKNQKELTFSLVGRKWVINATQIMLE